MNRYRSMQCEAYENLDKWKNRVGYVNSLIDDASERLDELCKHDFDVMYSDDQRKDLECKKCGRIETHVTAK